MTNTPKTTATQASAIKALAIKVHPKAEPLGIEYGWDKIPAIENFTKHILIPEIAVDKDGNGSVDIGSIVSGMPTVFSRANLFRNALDSVTDTEAEAAGLMLFYKSLISEWKGFISCIALNYKDIQIDRVWLAYSDGLTERNTVNIYEPKGAFGNMLFERKPLWCEQSLSGNAEKIPFIDVISFNGTVVGGTSPDCFLFTSVSYQLKDKFPFVNIRSGKFVDPLLSELSPGELSKLYGYAKHILNRIDRFRQHFDELDSLRKPEYGNLSGTIQNWMEEMIRYQVNKGYPVLDRSSVPEIGSLFQAPFSILFNYSTELYGSEGVISTDPGFEGGIRFDPKDLLMPDSVEIAHISFPDHEITSRDFLRSRPMLLLQADIKGTHGHFAYFALPLTPLALNVFGANLTALVGLDDSSAIKSRLSATYDPDGKEGERLIVQLKLFTQSNAEITKQIIYRVTQDMIIGNDILLWPNFISRQWNRYFMYSEMPHNDARFQAVPFIGDVEDENFRIINDKNGTPVYLASRGAAFNDPGQHGNLKVQLHVISNSAVADNAYKYEIYECNQPFKGIKFSYAGVDCGFGMIRYDGTGNVNGLPVNMLKHPRVNLASAYLGIDFGSTNSSVAYFSGRLNEVCDRLVLQNRRISLLSTDEKNNDERPAVEDEIFFFQNDAVVTNSIKSVLTLHDPRRMVNGRNVSSESLSAQAVKGGFPCFEKNLPIDVALPNRYILGYSRVGRAELVYDMKWSSQRVDKSYKTAYLGSLLLHIYAQLFVDGHEPHTLKWSYPSSMGKGLLIEYRGIWDSLKDISPIEGGVSLTTYSPSGLVDIGDTTGSSWQEGDPEKDTTTSPDWDAEDAGWGTVESPSPVEKDGWGAGENKRKSLAPEIAIETGPVHFDFRQLGNEESLTEACAVANYLVHSGYSVLPGELVLCFDIGGSTTDITALCQMEGGKAMIKQNSIRFAAQRVAQATKYSKNFRSVLLKMCEKKNISIQGLNKGENRFSDSTAPYYFEQLVDRLDNADFDDFYLLIAAECKEMMSVNLYVTGLIMYYAGQLAFKLRTEMLRSEDLPPAIRETPPRISIAFAGKGSRIFDWFNAVHPKSAHEYYTQMFIRGIGGEAIAKQTITPVSYPSKIININARKKEGNADVKYEVSKGLAIPTDLTPILVPRNKHAIEILGEEHFCVITSSGEKKYLTYGSSITSQMMEYVGDYFICSPPQGKPPCPRFMDFADLFFKVSSTMFGLKMSRSDFMEGFQDMNIENYIREDPDFIEAQKRKNGEQKAFDFVAPIIILEGMKFFEKHLLKGIQKP